MTSHSRSIPPTAFTSRADFDSSRLTPEQRAFAKVVGELLAEKWIRDMHEPAPTDRGLDELAEAVKRSS